MENKNLLNLLKWVLKKGPSETKKYQADSKKEQAWSEREPADSKKDQVKRTKLGMEGASLRNIFRYVAMIFAVLVMSIANIGMAWGVDYKPYLAEGFEGSTALTGNSCTDNNTTATANATSRTGSKVCYAYPSSASSSARYVGVGSNKTADKNWYIHAIVWVKGDNVASDKVQHQIGPYGASPATAYVNTTTSYTRCTIAPLKSGGSAKQIRLYFISNNGTPVAHFWYDDFIMYLSSEDVATDLTKPSSATSASATTSSISWTKGSDTGTGATGIQNTLIFHRTGGSVGSNDLTLNDQGIYSLTATEGPKVVGNWTLLSASVDAAATSYSGTFEAGHEYAIVHRDLAYNYSTPTYVTVAAAPACVAPSSVGISGTNKYLAGQDINLTATPTGHTGTPTYQWQKEINSVWTNLENGGNISGATTNNLQITGCDHYNSGQYRCVVSTGATCSTESSAYGVHVFSVYGGYMGDTWSDSEIQFSAGTSGTATVHLNAGSLYKFHVRSNNGAYYCNGEADYNGDGNADGGSTDGWYTLGSFSNWSFGRSSRNFRIYTGAEGDYTITVDIANALVSGDYVTVSVTYPTPTHPSEGYAYFEKPNDWNGVKLYWYTDNNSRLTSWDGSPEITATTTICGTTYYYTPLGTTFSNVIFRDKGSNQWTSLATSGFSGKYLDKTTYASPAWASFSTYTITYAANGGGGSMSATSGICPDADQAITSNAFTAPTGCASFAHWTANVAVKVGGAMVAAGNPIANGAIIEDINSDITLTAVWKLATPTITDNGDNTFSISGGIGGATYYYTTNNSTPTTSSSLYSSAVDFSAGETGITAKAIAHKDGYVDSDVASQACTYHVPATTVTATWPMVVNDAFSAVGSATNASITPSNATKAGSNIGDFNTVVNASFTDYTGKMAKIPATGTIGSSGSVTDDHYIKYSITVASGYKFKPTGFSATVGRFATDNGYAQAVLKTGATTIKSSAASKPSRSGQQSVAKTVYSAEFDDASEYAAGTVIDLYIYLGGGLANSKYYGIVAVSITGEYEAVACSEPAAPSGLTNGATTANTQVVTWTANGEDTWEVYHSTSSSTPGTDQTPTATVNSATYTFTGLTASTQYYWWARAKCDATHKSAWVAGTSFTTSAGTYTITTGAVTTIQPEGESTVGGSISASVASAAAGTTITLTATPTNADYVHTSWTVTKASSGTVEVSNNQFTMPAEAVTVTATFTRKYLITYLEEDNTTEIDGLSPTYYLYGVGATLPTPTKSGYTFADWYSQWCVYDDDEAPEGPGYGWVDGCKVSTISTTDYGNATYLAKWTAAASLTALVANTLYEVPDMIPSGATLTDDDQFFEGLSANTKFELIGSASGSTTPKANSKSTNDRTIDDITFDDGSMWFKGDAEPSSNIPTKFGLSFIVPEGGGKLYLYFNNTGTSTNIKLAKSGSAGSKPTLTDGFAAVDVTAGTYYLYGTGTTAPYSFYGLKLCSTYSVSITTNNTTKTSGETGSTAAVNGKAYTATFTANTGYTLPSDVTVSIGGTPATKGTEYTWSVSDGTGTLTVKAANVTGAIVVTVTGTAAATYALNYECNGAESGCPSNTTASALPNPLPSAPTKDGYTFGGWFTDEDLTVAAVAGAAMTEATTLYAKWTVNSSSECITITHWGTTNATTEAWAGSIADENKYKLAQSGSGTSNNKSTDSNASICLYYATTMSIYDSPTTTTDFANVTSVSFKVKLYNASKKPTITVSVGSDSGETVTLSENTDNSTFKTYTVNFGKQLTGAVKFKNNGSGDSGYKVYLDDIEICTASMSSCTTPALPTLSNQSLCEGADIAEWNATVTNASTISAAGETVTYSWKKKGNATELANTASFDLGASAAESQAGTYVVTVTVSKTGYASSTATKEVTLSVTDGVEVTGITADKATVYPTNSVTLTATASATATWQWYTCSNAEGDGEAIISGAESASFTIASAGAAGTYYYKAKATGSCGTGSMVYTLTVSAAAGGDCETEFWFAKAADKPESATAATHITGTPSGSSSATYTATIDGNSYPITGQTGQKTGNVTIVVPEDNEGTLYVVVQGSGSRTITLSKGGEEVGQYTPANSTWGTFTFSSLDEGTYTLVSSGNIGWGIIALKLCSGTACTDPEVTASVNNSTACVGSSVTFTATGAHASATYQWQKYSGGAWTDIAGAKAATYNIDPVATTDAMKYRVIASHTCNRTSNEVTLNVPVAPVFESFTATRSVMATLALSITDVEASDATAYAWYKSADATYDAGTDTRVGTTQELLLAAGGEAAGTTYYLFCVASNACGSTTSSAITVSVTALVEEDCATRGNESDAEFGFQNSGCGQGSYQSANCYTMNSNSKILVYSAPDGKYFKTMKVTIASSSASKASYNWSTDGGSTYTADGVAITGVTTTLTEKTIDLSAHGNVNEVKIGRNFGNGESSGTLYVSKICFEYTDACTATTVTPSKSSVNYEMGGAWSNPTFTLSVAGTLTYSSSNEDIASVDDDGTVTFNGEAGTVTITASYAGGTISATEYCASSGSYIINVSCPGGAPKIVPGGTVNMSGCNSSVTLQAKTQAGGDFADGTYQWFRNGVEIEGATSSSYTAKQAGVYTVAYTSAGGCTSLSTNNATVTSATVEPEVTKLVPFQYYHVDKTYTAQMKDRHLFSVKGSAAYGSTGKNFKLTMSRSGGAETDMTTAASIWVKRSDDGQVDSVMIDLNKLSGKYSEGDELVLTCAAVDCSGSVSTVYKDEITIHVIGATPTLALICSGTNKSAGTRKTSELTVGGDFLTGYNVADLCQQTGNTSFDANTEWGLYTRLKENYIVTPVNGYAVFNKLNYEPFDILLLTDYPKASKDDAAATVLDDMADLCDYRPMLSFKAHMVAKQPSKWAAKGFTTSPVVPKNTRTRLNIVCYAHPMFADMKTTATHIQKDNDDPSQIVYTMLTGAGYEGSKGLQGFELEAAENFVTIGLTHYNATPADGSPSAGLVTWTPGSEDRMLVTAVERQENLEARMIMFAVNCGAQSKFTETGRNVVLKCLEYLLDDDPLHVADCSFTFDNGAGNSMDAAAQKEACESCTGTKGDGKWSTAANWGPDYVVRPGKDTEVKIAAPVTVDPAVGEGAATNFTPKVRSVRILEGGKVEIPAGSYLEVVSTIRRQDGNDIYPTEVEDLHIGTGPGGNGTLIFNNSTEDTKAQVDMYSKGFIDHTDLEKEPNGVKNYQYIGTPFVEVNALYNYYGSWIYSWSYNSKKNRWGWVAVKNGGPMNAWTGYCISQESPTYYETSGTMTATGTVDIAVPAGENMVIGNSWTAPIDISKFATTDFENLEANVYFFNTGVDKTGTAGAAGSRYAPSTYVTVPINSSPYTGDDHIPSLQGFFVKNTNSSAGTLHLDYDKHVRGSSRAGRLSEEMHAPARRAKAAAIDEPTVLKIKASGENYDDKLLLLAREDFSTGFDNGWDGDKWDGNESALYIYTKDSEGTENSVSAVPELEGTVIGFRAGEDEAYTLNFEYLNSDEPLYLYDIDLNIYTEIRTGVTYRFFTNDKEKHERFIITLSNGQEIGTGVEPTSDSSLKGRAKKLIIEDKMYILVNGMLYDATGKVVK